MSEENATIRVWDPFVRVFHWSLVAAWSGGWITAEGWDGLHARLGYLVLVLVGLRLLWGLIGSRHARFTDFVRRPSVVATYLGQLRRGRPPHFAGHNPAGGWMVLLLLSAVSITAVSGALMVGGDGVLEDVHESAAGLTMLLIGLHLAGVVIGSLAHRENLVHAMISGNKPWRKNNG